MRHLLAILGRFLESNQDLEDLRTELQEHARGAAFKRLGFMLELLWPEQEGMIELARGRTSRGVVKLDPKLEERGRLDSRWGLWINTALKDEARR